MRVKLSSHLLAPLEAFRLLSLFQPLLAPVCAWPTPPYRTREGVGAVSAMLRLAMRAAVL